MLYTKILRGYATITEPAPVVKQEPATKQEKDIAAIVASAISDNTEKIMSALSQFQNAPTKSDLSDAVLSNDEANVILDKILEYQEKYFKDIPISDELSFGFVFNIPREVVKSSLEAAEKYPNADFFDPVILLYPLFCESPSDVMGTYLYILWEMIDKRRELINLDMIRRVGDKMSAQQSEETEDEIEEDDWPELDSDIEDESSDDLPPDVIRSMIDDARKYQDDEDEIDNDIPEDVEDE